MELKQLKIFLSVIESGSFTKAGQVLNYAQSTISDTISKLEDDLLVKLFNREHKKVFLTEDGKMLKSYAEKMIKLEQEARFSLKSSKKMINIGITESLCSYKFPSFFRHFLEEHLSFGFRFTIARCEKIPELLSEGSIDIGFTLDEATDYKALETIYLFDEPIVFVVGHKHPRLESILQGSLTSENIIISEGETGYNVLLSDAYQRNQIKSGHAIYMDSIEGIKSYVKDGFGISFMPRTTVESELRSGELIEFEIEQKVYKHQVSILMDKKNKMDILNVLIEAAKKEYQIQS